MMETFLNYFVPYVVSPGEIRINRSKRRQKDTWAFHCFIHYCITPTQTTMQLIIMLFRSPRFLNFSQLIADRRLYACVC